MHILVNVHLFLYFRVLTTYILFCTQKFQDSKKNK